MMRALTVLLVSSCLVALSSSAMGDGNKVMICPDGEICIVHTCGADTCSIWYCGNGECRRVVEYPRSNAGDGSVLSEALTGTESEVGGYQEIPLLKGEQVVPTLGGPGLSCGTQRCVIRTCNELQCKLMGFEGGRGILLGTFDNQNSVMELIAEDFLNRGGGSDKQ